MGVVMGVDSSHRNVRAHNRQPCASPSPRRRLYSPPLLPSLLLTLLLLLLVFLLLLLARQGAYREINGGEGFCDLRSRVLAQRDAMLEKMPAGTAGVIVSHMWVTRAIAGEALQEVRPCPCRWGRPCPCMWLSRRCVIMDMDLDMEMWGAWASWGDERRWT